MVTIMIVKGAREASVDETDVLVIGAGTMGSQVAYHLVQNRTKVVLLDPWMPPHSQGAHHGQTRLYRQLYAGPGPYVPLALLALEGWRGLEARSGRRLFLSQGVLNLDHEGAGGHEGKVEAARRHGLRADVLSLDEVGARWPAFGSPTGYRALWEPDAGVLDAPGAVAAALAAAREGGAEVVAGATVREVSTSEGLVTVKTDVGDWRAGRVVVTAGTSTPGLVPELELPVEPIRQTVGWFDPQGPGLSSPHFPGFTFNTPEGQFYGFPSFDGSGVKVGRHDGGTPFAADQAPLPFGAHANDGAELARFVANYLPGVAGPLVRGASCRYDRTPDEDFRIGRVSGAPVWYATGFSGHGFKFAPAVGRLLAEWVESGVQPSLFKAFG